VTDADVANYKGGNFVSIGSHVSAAKVVASTAKDVIEVNYQMSNNGVLDIYGFELGEDLLVLRNHNQGNTTFSFNLKEADFTDVTIQRNDEIGGATISGVNSLVAKIDTTDNSLNTYTINLVGLQGYDFNTNVVCELFGVTPA